MKGWWLIICLCGLSAAGYAAQDISENLGRPAMMLYYGETAKQVFGNVVGGEFTRIGENSFTVEGSYAFSKDSWIHRFFYPISDMVQLAADYTYRHDYRRDDHVHEGNLFLLWSYRRFPWSDFLRTSLSFGDGISFDSHPPAADCGDYDPRDVSRFLNYMIVELAFALPSAPRAQLVFRIHHKCTAWGFFPGRAAVGSTGAGVGFRWYF